MLKLIRNVYCLATGRNELGEPLNLDGMVVSDKKRHGRYARGNVSLQNGSYLSVSEMEKKRETLARVQFPAR